MMQESSRGSLSSRALFFSSMRVHPSRPALVRGFTLIETIVAVVLLGLFAVGIGSFLRQQSTRGSEVLSRQTALNLAQSQIERIRAVGPVAYNYGVDLSGPIQGDTTPGQDLREVFFRDRFFMDGEGLQRGDEASQLLPYEVVIEGRVQCVGGPITEETPVSLFAWRTYDRATGVLRSCAEFTNPQKPVVSYRVLVGAGQDTPASGSSALPAMEIGVQFTERDLLGALCFGGQVWDAGAGACGCPAGQSFQGGRCSCGASLVWNGSACVTSSCAVSPPRDVVQQPQPHPSILAADPSLPAGAYFYQQMRPDWCAGGAQVPSDSDWGSFSGGGAFVSGGLTPSALNFPARTSPDRAHINPVGPFSHWNYACAFGTDYDPTHGVCGCSGALQVNPPSATMSLARQASGGWLSTGSGTATVACPGPSANAGADASDGTRTRTFSYSQTCAATGTPGVYSDQGLQTSSTDSPCGCNAALGLVDSGFGTCTCAGGAPWDELSGRCGCVGSSDEIQACSGGRTGDMVRTRSCQAGGTWGGWSSWDDSGCACSAGLGWDGSSCTCLGSATEEESASCTVGVGQQTRSRSRACTPTGWGAWGAWSGWNTATCGCAGNATDTRACSGGRDGEEVRSRSCSVGAWSAWSGWDDSGCSCPSGLSWDGNSCGCAGASFEEEFRTCSTGFGDESRARSRTCSPSGWGAWSAWSGWNTSGCGSCVPGSTQNVPTESEPCPVGSVEAQRFRTGTQTCTGSGTWGSVVWSAWSACTSTPPPPAACPFPGMSALPASSPACVQTTCSLTGAASGATVFPGMATHNFSGQMGTLTTTNGLGQQTTETVVAWYEGLVCNPAAAPGDPFYCNMVTSYYCAAGVNPACPDGRPGLCGDPCQTETAPCDGGMTGLMSRTVCLGVPNAWDRTMCQSPPPVCAAPRQLVNGMCICPGGQVWNGSTCDCTGGQVWNGISCVNTGCAAPLVWNGSACACPSGQTWNGSTCVTPSAQPTCGDVVGTGSYSPGFPNVGIRITGGPFAREFCDPWYSVANGSACVTADVGYWSCVDEYWQDWTNVPGAPPVWIRFGCSPSGYIFQNNIYLC